MRRWDIQDGNWQAELAGREPQEMGGNWQIGRREEEFTAGDGTSKVGAGR